MNRNKKRDSRLLLAFSFFLSLAAAAALWPQATGAQINMLGEWNGFFVGPPVAGYPSTTPQPIDFDITSQSLTNFGGTFDVPAYGGTLSGFTGFNGRVKFSGDGQEIDLESGSAGFVDYDGGAATIDGRMNIVPTVYYFSGMHYIRSLRPFNDVGDCPCTPPAGVYTGTWIASGASGTIRFDISAAQPGTPTKFVSPLQITINGGPIRQYNLLATGNSDGEVISIGAGPFGRITLTGLLTRVFTARIRGGFTTQLNEGGTIQGKFTATRAL